MSKHQRGCRQHLTSFHLDPAKNRPQFLDQYRTEDHESAARTPKECARCIVDPKVGNRCFRLKPDMERCVHCALQNGSCLPVRSCTVHTPSHVLRRHRFQNAIGVGANEVMRAKKVARRTRKPRDITKASRLAILLSKRLKSSNKIAKKESAHPAILDELRYIGLQLRLMNLLGCSSVCFFFERLGFGANRCPNRDPFYPR